ncbi:UNVERIFIED_CONTAM: hypothetical protein ABIC26_004806 [Paenibacillus sp. PvR008]
MIEIQQQLTEYIRAVRRAMIWTEELEQCFEGKQITYEQFAGAVLALEESGVLHAVKSAGRRAKLPSLALRYRVNKPLIKSALQQRLHQYRLELHPLISLDRYFAQDEAMLELDLPYLQRIHRYLQEQGLPLEAATASERSFALVGDEKWITEKKGRTLLERIGLWDKLRIDSGYDPVMFAVHPKRLSVNTYNDPCLHLIVENRTTFQALLPYLSESRFCTLIYGCGNKIVGNFGMFSKQYPVRDRTHRFYYFGDLDLKGIQIWHDLAERYCEQIIPAEPFYSACLGREAAPGKTNQRADDQALRSFVAFLSERDGQRLKQSLAGGCYYPQEALSAQQLREIWRSAAWK